MTTPERRALFDEVVRDHGAALWRLTAGYAHSDEERKDLHQEILVAVWQALPRFGHRSSLRTFVYRIAHNRGTSHRAYEGRRRHRDIDDLSLPDPGPAPDEQAEVRRRRHVLLSATRSLPATLGQVLMLHLDGLSNGEIAEVVGISTGNVAVRLTRARSAVMERIREIEAARPTRPQESR